MSTRIHVLQFIVPTGFYGAERWILALNKHLDNQLVRSDLVVTRESEKPLDLFRQFDFPGCKAFEIKMESRFSLSSIRQLSKIIQDRDIQIIHTHGYKADIIGLIAARLTGIKSLSTPHGFGEPKDFKLRLYIQLGKFFLRFFDCVAPLSKQLESEVVEAGVKHSNMHFIRNAVDLGEVECFRKNRVEVPKSKPQRIGYIGQIIERKKVDHMLDTFDQLWSHNQNLELIIVGDGDKLGLMQERAKKLASAENIKFLGFRNDRLELLSSFDLFVMTSSDEGIPRCLMEAMAMGTPVVAYNIPGVGQLIRHEKTGLLAQYGDREALKTLWQRSLDNQKFASEMAEAGRQFVQANYSAQRMADEYTQLYANIIST